MSGVVKLNVEWTFNENALPLQQGTPLFVIWAYHSSNDVQPGLFSQHTTRGFQQEILIPAMTLSPTPGMNDTN